MSVHIGRAGPRIRNGHRILAWYLLSGLMDMRHNPITAASMQPVIDEAINLAIDEHLDDVSQDTHN